jgi:serine O-acetyltransferase
MPSRSTHASAPSPLGSTQALSPSPPSAESSEHLALADRILSAADGLGLSRAAEGPLPARHDIRVIGETLVEVLFPESRRQADDGTHVREHLAAAIADVAVRLETAIFLGLHRHCVSPNDGPSAIDRCRERARAITAGLLAVLPDLRAALVRDVLAAYESDPAASGVDEIVACYPGLYAIAIYRVANQLLRAGAEVVPRMLTEHAHSRTGIDIHPGATIGESFFIDHGTGIVVGETTLIGNRVRIYQGVTLGALSVRDRGRTDKPNPKKRHPTIEDEVIIYANATILGGETVIGRGAVVGGNAWITYSVPPGIRVGVGT